MIRLAESDGEPPVYVIVIVKKKDCVGVEELLLEATGWCVGAERVPNPVVQVCLHIGNEDPYRVSCYLLGD